MKAFHRILNALGYRAYRHKYLPRGVDWIWDVKRASSEPIQVAVDVGANKGEVSLRLVEVFPGCTVHAFEPSPPTFGVLQQHVGSRTAIQCHRIALSNQAGVMSFLHSEPYPTTSRLVKSDTAGAIEVPVDTGERVFKQHHLTPDLLKTDTEGWDLEVLKGFGPMVRNIRWVVSEVIFDVSVQHRKLSGFNEIHSYLMAMGFSLHSLCDYNHFANGAIRNCNALWKNIGQTTP